MLLNTALYILQNVTVRKTAAVMKFKCQNKTNFFYLLLCFLSYSHDYTEFLHKNAGSDA
jgi:hypothetical protein